VRKSQAESGSGSGNAKGPPPPLAGGGPGEGDDRNTSPLAHARAMHHASKPAERRLWQGLRKQRIGGLNLRRQVPLEPYIADFYCPSARLVVEVDGVSHIDAPGDAVRDSWMAKRNIRVARISNRDVLRNLKGLLIAIGELARMPPPPTALPQGEGEGSTSSNSTSSAVFLHV
jgi:very-short-patch-repair endonuclease